MGGVPLVDRIFNLINLQPYNLTNYTKRQRQKDEMAKGQIGKNQKDYGILDSGQISRQLYNYDILDSGQISH